MSSLVWTKTTGEIVWEMQAGPLKLLFDTETGSIRRIQFRQTELIRQVYGAVRNERWGTVQPIFSQLRIEHPGSDSFKISFIVSCRENPIDYVWVGLIEGNAEQIRFQFDGEAQSDFFSNRIGLCILHPTQTCAGQPCEVEHVGGKVEKGAFPELISPHQPFQNMRAIRHRAEPGLNVEVRFEGDVFEMEDQRNWTDASFKIYPRPLELPFPFSVRRGDKVRQIVTIRWSEDSGRAIGAVPSSGTSSQPKATATVGIDWESIRSKPAIGFSLPIVNSNPNDNVLQRLRRLRPEHLRYDCFLWRSDWTEQFEIAVTQAKALGAGLHVAVFLKKSDDKQLRRLADECRRLEAPVRLWLGLDATDFKFVKVARDMLGEAFPKAQFAAGTAENFAELNRNRPPPDVDWMPCFPMNPQVHAVDGMTVIENIAAQPETIRTAYSFSKQQIVVSPITLLPCPPAGPDSSGKLVEPVADPRQQSFFGAAWALGSLAVLLPAHGVRSLTYFRTIGPGGLMAADGARVFPVYHVFAGIAEIERLAATELIAPGGRRIATLAGFTAEGSRVIWMANLAATPAEVAIQMEDGLTWKVKELNEKNAVAALREPDRWMNTASDKEFRLDQGRLLLPPYGLLRLSS